MAVSQRSAGRALLAKVSMTDWQPIETAPKDDGCTYLLIAERWLVPDIARWEREIPERLIYGNLWKARPAGWFSVNLSRSRLTPTHWMPVQELPK